MASGEAGADATEFELIAVQGSDTYGVCSTPFLDHTFKTVEFRIQVKINDDGTWTYHQDTVLKIAGQDELFHHRDTNTLHKIGDPILNPLVSSGGRDDTGDVGRRTAVCTNQNNSLRGSGSSSTVTVPLEQQISTG